MLRFGKAVAANRRQRRGVVVPLVAILLPVLVILSAFVINLAWLELNTAQLYVAADAAARAGGRTLAIERSAGKARAAAKKFAELNSVAGDGLTLADSDIVFGQSRPPKNGARYAFTPGGVPNAVRVRARRAGGSPDGPLNLLLSGVLPITTVEAQQESISTQVDVDVALVIDKSGSMAYAADEPAVYPPIPKSAPSGWDFCDAAPPDSRWRDLVAAVEVFAKEIHNSPTSENVCLVTYSDGAVVDKKLTSDALSIPGVLNKYTKSFCSGGTNIGAGLGAGVNALNGSGERQGAVKAVVVLTDGIHNQGSDPVKVAKKIGKDGVTIFSVTFSDEADKSRMKKVAEAGLGAHFHANNASDLAGVFVEIAKLLPTLITE